MSHQEQVWKAYEDNPITHSAAHYLMTIQQIQEDQGYVRAVDVAGRMGITRGSCSLGLKSLRQKGLVNEDHNKMLSLSEQGMLLAQVVQKNDQLLVDLLHDVLGVEAEQSEVDACKMEHLLSLDTSIQLCNFMHFFRSDHPAAKAFRQALADQVHTPASENHSCEQCSEACLFRQASEAS